MGNYIMMHDHEIVVWGTGNIARKFFYEKGYKYNIQYFIDNYEPHYNMNNLETYYPDEVDLRKYKIVIALADWKSVAKQLEKDGLSFYKNYLPYDWLDKDEIPIIDILSNISDLSDIEEVLRDYAGNRKMAVINGNCQTSRIKMYLKQNREFSKEYVFLDMPALHMMENDQIELLMQNKNILKNVRLFISQNISLNNAFDYRLSNEYLIKLMSDQVNYIKIANLFWDIYFPQSGKEQDPEREEFVRNIFPYNDHIIDELLSRPGFTGGGYTADEIIQIIKLENLFTSQFLEWILQYRLKQLREREILCDIKMLDYIEENFSTRQLFYSRNHPINEVLKEESTRILRYINPDWNLEIEHEETIPTLSVNQEFIYPSILNGLELSFQKRYYSDSISECKYSIEEEIKKYIYCCDGRR